MDTPPSVVGFIHEFLNSIPAVEMAEALRIHLSPGFQFFFFSPTIHFGSSEYLLPLQF